MLFFHIIQPPQTLFFQFFKSHIKASFCFISVTRSTVLKGRDLEETFFFLFPLSSVFKRACDVSPQTAGVKIS